MKLRSFPYRYLLVGIWALFTVTLTAWWIYFAIERLEGLVHSTGPQALEFVRYQKMLIWEGGTLVVCLLGGGIALAWLVYRELRETRRIKNFFAAFSHELKTPLASMLLTAEILKERCAKCGDVNPVDSFLTDLNTLALRLENSLFLANLDKRNYLLENLSLSEALESVKNAAPELEVALNHDCRVTVDRRALESILGNLLRNALLHGKAGCVNVTAERINEATLRIMLSDDGSGFSGDREKLGSLFHRHYSGSGSGIGLYLVSRLIREMNGSFAVLDTEGGFAVEIILPGVMT
jgi:signal transduction histidine kinase